MPYNTDQCVKAEVVFGTPSKYCAGDGICMVSYRALRLTSISCPHTPARIRRVPGEGLVFLFSKDHINTDALRAYFKAPYFLVEEQFALPAQLVKRWGLSSAWIPPGRYTLEEYTREWRLFFPMQDDNSSLLSSSINQTDPILDNQTDHTDLSPCLSKSGGVTFKD